MSTIPVTIYLLCYYNLIIVKFIIKFDHYPHSITLFPLLTKKLYFMDQMLMRKKNKYLNMLNVNAKLNFCTVPNAQEKKCVKQLLSYYNKFIYKSILPTQHMFPSRGK